MPGKLVPIILFFGGASLVGFVSYLAIRHLLCAAHGEALEWSMIIAALNIFVALLLLYVGRQDRSS